MMRHGHRRDGELDALCRYTKWLSKVSKLVDDEELRAFARRVLMFTMNELIQEQAMTREHAFNIVNDRLADCADCKANGEKPCFATGKYVGCKWFKPQARQEFVQDRLGDDAIKYLEKYKSVGREQKT